MFLRSQEKRALRAELRKHDYEGARLVALRFAYRLTQDRDVAQDLLARVDRRLARLGWDSATVSLPRYLCRLVWSEWILAHNGATTIDAEKARTAIAKLRALFEAEKPGRDVVNLIWLDAALAQEGQLPDAQTLAAQTGRTATEFYAAAKRRKRAVARVLGAE